MRGDELGGGEVTDRRDGYEDGTRPCVGGRDEAMGGGHEAWVDGIRAANPNPNPNLKVSGKGDERRARGWCLYSEHGRWGCFVVATTADRLVDGYAEYAGSK